MANFFDQFDPAVSDIPESGRRLLDAIAGGEAQDYNTIYGGRKFNDFADHPRIDVPIRSGPNVGKTSSAAGRYQFLGSTWDEVAQEAGLPDFSPDSQDQGAWHLAQKTYRARTGRDLTPDLEASQGDPQGMSRIGRQLAGVWTSLPGGIEPNSATRGFGARAAQGGGEDNVQVANFFDKFDAPGAGPRTKSDAAPLPMVPAGPKNFFDQFDAGRPTVGAPSAPAAAAKPEAEGPGITGYAKESGKAALRGAVESAVSSRLKGAAVTPPSQGMNQFAFSPAELELADEEWRKSLKPGQIEASPLYRGGKALEDWMEATFGSNKQLHPLVEDVMAGFGSLAGNVAPMFLRGMGPAAIATTPMQGAGEAVDRAIKAKATPEQIARAGSLGNVSGATEFADALLPTLGSTGKIAGLIGKVGYKILAGAFIEGGQEGLQQFTQNLISRGIYNPKQDLSEDVAYNALVGAIVGGGAGAVMKGHGVEGESQIAPPSVEALAAALAASTPPPPVAPPIPSPSAGGAGVAVAASEPPTTIVKGAEVQPVVAMPVGPQEPVAPPRPALEPSVVIGGVAVDPRTLEPLAARVPNPETQFKTSKGSVYTQFDDGTTIRNKAERPEHPGDTGIKERSQRTVYMDVDAANRVEIPPSMPEWRYVDHGDGTLSVAWPNPETGQWGISPSQRKVKYWNQPGVGLVPLELWNRESINGQAAYGKRHFGNPIIDIETPPFSRPAAQVEIPGMVTRNAAMRIGGTAPAPSTTATLPQAVEGPGVVPPPPPTEAALRGPNTLSADHVRFMQEEAKRLEELPKLQDTITGQAFDPEIGTIDSSLTPLKEEIATNPGVDQERIADLLSQSLYGDMSNVTAVSVKEMFQNGFDAVKGYLEKHPGEHGNVDVDMNQATRTITVKDDGLGMPASVMGNEFLQVAGTKKETQRASGGHGIAKMQFLFGSVKTRVRSLREGQYAELNTSGPALRAAMSDKTKAPNMTVRPATAEDLKLFPKGHGTIVEVQMPESYENASTGKVEDIEFSAYEWAYKVLQRSPLFDNISVRFNGGELPMGSAFPMEDFTQFANVNFDWGTARIYIEKNPNTSVHGANAHVLSNGLWQFSIKIKREPNNFSSEAIPYTLYIDVNPRVRSGQPGYPFSLNRQEFSDSVKKEFGNISNYISLLYQGADLENSSKNFGSMQYLSFDPKSNGVVAAPPVLIEPKAPPPKTALTLINPGDTVRVENGKLIVNGRQVPELTPEMLEKYKGVDTTTLRVEQSEIDPQRVILHDNVDVEVSSVQTLSITEYGRERFGERFDEYVFGIGNLFRELRDIVVDAMPRPVVRVYRAAPPVLESNTYEELAREGIGVSFDIEYRGVSIRLPFAGMFINPFTPEYSDPVRAAVGMVGTMVHELAHYKVRAHNAAFPAEMQRILIALDTHPTFDFSAFKQRAIDAVSNYMDVFEHMNGVFRDGNLVIKPRGKRFEDSSAEQAGDGRAAGTVDRFGRESERGTQLSEWVALGKTVPEGESGRGESDLKTSGSRSGKPSDNGRRSNYNATRNVDPGITAPPQQPEVSGIASNIATVLNNTAGGGSGGGGRGPTSTGGPNGASPPTGTVGQQIREARSHADRMNWYYKFMTGLTELLDANPYFEPLRKYVERVRDMHNDETKVHDSAIRIMKDWRHLGEQAKNLESFILDLQSMPYLTPAARGMGLWRHPTQIEFNALVAKHRLSAAAVDVYTKITKMNDTFMKLVEQNAIEAAQRRYHDNPVKLAEKLDEIRAHGVQTRAYPFFPFTRFGRYYVAVKDQAGNVVHFETFEPKRFVGISLKRAQRYQAARKAELQRKALPGHTVESDVLPETAEPFIGLPTLMLQQAMGEDIGLTESQINSLKLLQSMRNPAMSFKDRGVYDPVKGTQGYSLDLRRSFARYYFHGGRYYAKLRHAWALRGHVAEAQMAQTANKGRLVGDYMADHLRNTVLDARGDFGFIRGSIFLWAMGYVPAAATQNLTQTPMITLPFLGAKFGDLRASRELVAAMGKLSTFYKRGKLEGTTQFELDALSYGVKTGRITETQAADLAAISAGGTLFSGQGGAEFQRHAIAFQEKAAFMFEMAEQWNRRIAYRAALNLAQKQPDTKFVKDSVRKYKDEYEQLVVQYSDPAKAAAIVTAVNVVDQTQYVYARYARPRFMRGPLGATLFVFKRYLQSTVNMLGHNKSDVFPRFLIMAMIMGGMGGVPGYEDMKHVFRAIASWWFGKDMSADRIAREYILQWFNGKVDPDLVLHGLARRGFGIPALLDLMGSVVTGKPGRGLDATRIDPRTGQRVPNAGVNVPFPVLDRSRALSMGTILPFELGKLMGPDVSDEDKLLNEQVQKASGAVFSVAFNVYKALTDSHMKAADPKRWERAVPRALGSASRSYRAFTEERERGKGGPNSAPTIVPYDRRDTEQMMEILAIGAGYQTLRNAGKWDAILAEAEVKMFWDTKRKGLLESYFEANRGRNVDEIAKVRDEIIRFNKDLPDSMRPSVITPDTIVRSITNRAKELQAKESGTPAQINRVPLAREIQRLYPESVVDVRRVR